MFRATKDYIYLLAAVFSLTFFTISCGDGEFATHADEQVAEAELQLAEEINQDTQWNQLAGQNFKPQDPTRPEGSDKRFLMHDVVTDAKLWELLPGHPEYKTPEEIRECKEECNSAESIGIFEARCMRHVQENPGADYESCVLELINDCEGSCSNIIITI